MLRMPTTKSLKIKKNITKNTWAKVAEAKLEKHNLEIELLREKREFLKEKNQYERQKLQLEIELLQTQLKKVKKDDI